MSWWSASKVEFSFHGDLCLCNLLSIGCKSLGTYPHGRDEAQCHPISFISHFTLSITAIAFREGTPHTRCRVSIEIFWSITGFVKICSALGMILDYFSEIQDVFFGGSNVFSRNWKMVLDFFVSRDLKHPEDQQSSDSSNSSSTNMKKQQKKQQENSKNILEGGRGKTKRKGRGCPGGGAVQEEGSFWGGGWTGVWGGANRGKHTRSQTHGHHMHAHRMQPHTHHTPQQSWEWHGKRQFWLRWRRGRGGRHFTLWRSIGIEMAWSVVNSCCWRCVNYETSQMGYCHCCRLLEVLYLMNKSPQRENFNLGFDNRLRQKNSGTHCPWEFWKWHCPRQHFRRCPKFFPTDNLPIFSKPWHCHQILLHSTFFGWNFFSCIIFLGYNFFRVQHFPRYQMPFSGFRSFLSTKIWKHHKIQKYRNEFKKSQKKDE